MEIELLINPFRIDIDPIERLLLVNLEQDPDTTYVGFEPQVFDDPVNGRGHLVIGWRQDSHVDVFYQAGLRLDPAKYDIAGQGLANKVERELVGATFEINEFGVQAHYEFEDVHNRPVLIHINEQSPRARKPFGNGPPPIPGRRIFSRTQPASTSCARHGNESEKEIKSKDERTEKKGVGNKRWSIQ